MVTFVVVRIMEENTKNLSFCCFFLGATWLIFDNFFFNQVAMLVAIAAYGMGNHCRNE